MDSITVRDNLMRQQADLLRSGAFCYLRMVGVYERNQQTVRAYAPGVDALPLKA